ncbi:hypothetical protein ACFV29_45260 [Streptomyces sp. NPDC059690]|uniref:hypothetical protein n=1 Tax=Streptomyces TaxID=1883 RepID=UPI0009391FF7|nr:hypothetical protein [Streptomyces sp. CB02366]OKJ26580.1 hypothetical protein AMK24_31330 [Streptomyces sp. CB02366]TVP36629.1 hypothetical protein A3L22_27670 [Streptomyces griseus subsp. griseus]WSS59654.1 hypothetical protein OG543_29980 [Streptomyces sp. NBC_01178]
MLQIQIGPEREADPDDRLGRSTIGWRPGMSEDEVWETGRGIWKFNADRALSQDEVQIINTEGTVLAVAKITGISKHGDRYALEGELQRGDDRVGRATQVPHLSRNPVTYI